MDVNVNCILLIDLLYKKLLLDVLKIIGKRLLRILFLAKV